MGLEELITSLSREAEDEKRRILDGARAEAAVILAAGERNRDGILDEVKRKASGSLDAERSRRLHGVRIQANAQVREAKVTVVAEASRRALALAEEHVRSAGWRESLAGLIAECVSGLDGGVVHVRPADEKEARKIVARLGKDFSVAVDEAMAPGVRVLSLNGLVETDNTLPTRLRRWLALGEDRIAMQLFAGEDHAR
jgi:vacuolar-type H+-ATPase subunit E/Vma4